jgi:phosphatidylethanolamine-binding protein (PEBP) family uncharacterized protein
MTDPDAPSGTWTHYVATIQSDGTIISEPYQYQPPSPPKGSGRHRYIFNIYNAINELQSNPGLSGNDYYTQMLKPIIDKYKPITNPIQFTVKSPS